MSKRGVGHRERGGGVARVHDARIDPPGAQRPEYPREARDLLVGVRILRLVGHREVRTHARERERLPVEHAHRERDRVLDPASDAMHAGVDLEVHSQRRAARGAAQRVDPGLRVHHGREAMGDDRRRRIRYRLGKHEHGGVDPGLAQLHAFLDERDPETARARLHRGTRDRHGAVPVRLGFDDGHDRGGRHERGQHAHVLPNGFEIDLGPYRPVGSHLVR